MASNNPRRDPGDSGGGYSSIKQVTGPSIERPLKSELRRMIRRDLPLSSAESIIMDQCLRDSTDVWAGLYDGTVGCVFGIKPPTFLSDKAYFWLYTNDEMVSDHVFVFIRGAQRVLDELLKRYAVIHGVVDPKYPKARKWIRWMGGEFNKASGDGPLEFQIRRK